MAKTDKADKGEAVAKAPRVVLTKEARNAIFKAAGGKCFIFGTQLEPLDPWHVEDNQLLSPEAKKLKRGRSLDELRKGILEELADAQAAAERTRVENIKAEEHNDAVKAALGPLVEGDAVRFAGERAV